MYGLGEAYYDSTCWGIQSTELYKRPQSFRNPGAEHSDWNIFFQAGPGSTGIMQSEDCLFTLVIQIRAILQSWANQAAAGIIEVVGWKHSGSLEARLFQRLQQDSFFRENPSPQYAGPFLPEWSECGIFPGSTIVESHTESICLHNSSNSSLRPQLDNGLKFESGKCFSSNG